jgi:hypothetical protein
MTPAQAAVTIGCSTSQVRTLCRQGKLAHTTVRTPGGQTLYNIHPNAARAYRDRPQAGGWPRGCPRG